MSAFTDKICWRFIVPRRRYFWSLRVATVVPEIKGEINRQAFFALVWPFVVLAALVAMAPGMVGVVLLFISRILTGPIPDLKRLNGRAVEAAWEKVPLEEIRERLGTRGKINPKPQPPNKGE